jgi:hypothetical protein
MAALTICKIKPKEMSFAVLHVQKTTANPIGLGMEIGREYEPHNADPERKHLNQMIIDNGKNLSQAIDDRIKEGYTGKTAIRKDAVKSLTYVLTGSHERMHELDQSGRLDAWVQTNLDWLIEKHGRENIVKFALHMDERTPHLHAVVVPLTTDGRLSAKELLGNKAQMKELQTDYANRMRPFGLERGRDGGRSTHVDIKDYYKQLNEQIPQVKKELQQLQAEVKDYSKMKALKETAGAFVSKLTKKDETKELKDQVQHLQTENANLKTGLNNAAANLSEFERATERLYQENQRLKSAIGGQKQQQENELAATKAQAKSDTISLINRFARKNLNLPGRFDVRGDTVHFEPDDKGQSQGLAR